MLSNFQGALPHVSVKRWKKEINKKVNVPQPKYITDYNTHMGGIEKMDYLINIYKIKICAKKWYFPLFSNINDMAIMNAHVFYCMIKFLFLNSKEELLQPI